MNSPTQRTLKYFRSLGFDCDITEKFNSFTKRRHDLFGIIDILALWPAEQNRPAKGLQACAGASHANRVNKALAEPRLRKWLAGGHGFEVVSWSKRGARGKPKRWTVRRASFRLVGDDIVVNDDTEAA